MAAKGWNNKPLALIVEDREEQLELRMELLEQMGFHSIGASNYQDAIAEFRATPSIDIVITDIDLGEKHPDRNGVFLAREIKRERTNLPVVGYSAAFDEGDIDRQDWALFDSHVSKGKSGPEQIRSTIKQWREIALGSRARAMLIKSELSRLQAKYEILDRDLEYLREYLPGGDAPAGAANGDDYRSAEEMLHEAGYALGVLDPQECQSQPKPDWLPVRSTPYLFWQEDGFAGAELPGVAELYGAGPDEEAALASLLELAYTVHLDLAGQPLDRLSARRFAYANRSADCLRLPLADAAALVDIDRCLRTLL